MQSLNVLMVTAWGPTAGAGGVNTVIRTLCKGLQGTHKTLVLVNDWDSPDLRMLTDEDGRLAMLRLRLPFLASKPLTSFFGWLRDFPRTLRNLKHLLDSNEIDIIHLHYASAYQFYFRIMRWFGGPPYLVTLHGSDTTSFARKSTVDRALILWTLRGAASVVAVSGDLARQAEGTFANCCIDRVIPGGVDVAELEGCAAAIDSATASLELPEKFFLCVANLTHVKGIDLAIRAWAHLKDRIPDLHLVIAGEPREQWQHCQELLDSLDCRARVHMIGIQPHEKIVSLMRTAMGVICPSRSEGQGLVLLEAGALGAPVICSNIGPFMAATEGGNHTLVVPPEDPPAIAEAAARLAEDSELRQRLAQSLKEHVNRKFSSQQMVKAYASLYEQLLGTTCSVPET